jgi:shikimate kinase
MKGKATTHGAATVVNGIACGKGAAFGVALETTATVELTGEPGRFEVSIEDEPGEETALAEHCVRLVLEKFGLAGEHGARIATRSQIPMSRGLKSSSAAANLCGMNYGGKRAQHPSGAHVLSEQRRRRNDGSSACASSPHT